MDQAEKERLINVLHKAGWKWLELASMWTVFKQKYIVSHTTHIKQYVKYTNLSPKFRLLLLTQGIEKPKFFSIAYAMCTSAEFYNMARSSNIW